MKILIQIYKKKCRTRGISAKALLDYLSILCLKKNNSTKVMQIESHHFEFLISFASKCYTNSSKIEIK